MTMMGRMRLLIAIMLIVSLSAAVSCEPITPFLIYGNVAYTNGTPCSSIDINVTNLQTGCEWQIGTEADYYQIMLTSGIDLDVSKTSETLQFNVTDGISSNTIRHGVIADERYDGGIFSLNLTPETVEVSIADANVNLSDTVTLPILITNIGNYGTGTINIEYDPAVVHVTDVTSSPDSTVTAKNIDNAIGVVRISAWNLGGVSGVMIFANVTFTSVGVGSTPLNLTVDTLQDIAYQEISSVTVSNGSFRTSSGDWGDVNEDGQLTTADAAIVLQMAVRGEYSEKADVNEDSQVTSLDALMILQMLAKYD